MSVSTLIGAAGVGAGLAVVVTYLWMKLRASSELLELEGTRARMEQVAGERDRALERWREQEVTLEAKAGRVGELEQDVLRVQAPLKEQVASLESAIAAERRAHREKVEDLTSLGDEWVARIGQSAGAAFDGRGKELVELLKSELSGEKAAANTDLARRHQAIEDLVGPLAASVANVGQRVQDLDRHGRHASVQLGEQLRALGESEAHMRAETNALARALHEPNVRGGWGELHLERAVEMAGMVEHADFTRQVHLDRDGEVLRPDLVVRLPKDRHLPVDAKAPIGAYLEACATSDKKARAAALGRYARGLRVHVKALANKEYWARLESSPECILMFLPGDHLLAAGAESDPTLIEDAIRQRVHIVTPTTLIVSLRVVATAWQQDRVAEDARAVAELGQELHDRLLKYLGLTNKLGSALTRAVAAYNEVVGSAERRLLPTARRLASKAAIDATKDLPAPQPINLRAREGVECLVVEDRAGEDAA
jgi:DNA recombination protein RmuC